MIKFGLYKVEQLSDHALQSFKNASITLYDQILDLPNAPQIAERILQRFADERGAYKRTYEKRFEDFDQKVISLLDKEFAPGHSLVIHDVAVSDARTSVDFFKALSQNYNNLLYCASDYDPEVLVLESGHVKVTVSKTGKTLEIVCPPFVFNLIKKDNFFYYPINHIALFFVKHLLVNPLLQKYKLGQIQSRPIMLFCPQAQLLSNNNTQFKLGQHDLLKPSPISEPLTILRAMNVLNTSYFTKPEMQQAIKLIYKGLSENGFFITGSNQNKDSCVNGGVYQKHKGKFKKFWQSGSGSPVSQIIEGLNYDS